MIAHAREAAEHDFNAATMPASWIREVASELAGTGVEIASALDFPTVGVMTSAGKAASARRTFSARAADGAVARYLDLTEGCPVQSLEQVTYLADGRPIEYSDVWIHSGRLRVTSLLSRR